MSSTAVTPFKIAISEEEAELLTKKLELTRLPSNIANATWGEDNKVTYAFIKDTIEFWLKEYDWRKEEAKINELPQFKTAIELQDIGVFDIHFVHATSGVEGAVPLLFLHGWPGSFLEVQKLVKPLLAAGFDVVAPSHPGFGFSSYTDNQGLKFFHLADIHHKLMLRLGYDNYAVQGGDVGSLVGRAMALRYPDHARALHLNMVQVMPPEDPSQFTYSEFDKGVLERTKWFSDTQLAYQAVQGSKTRTFGFSVHDSPVALLAWIADKLFAWADDYPWTPTEIITWTLLHYFPGPTTALEFYRENLPPLFVPPPEMMQGNYVKVPTGLSAFPKEALFAPRAWVEKENNVVFWKEHTSGGHFAAWERPEELVEDVTEFIKANWKRHNM